jgi:hypothetical protein
MWLEALAFFSTLFKQLFKRNVVQHWLSNQLFQAGGVLIFRRAFASCIYSFRSAVLVLNL